MSFKLLPVILAALLQGCGVDENIAISEDLPLHKPEGVSFTDEDFTPAEVSGTIQVTRATDETAVSHYTLYWGTSSLEKLESNAIIKLAKDVDNLTYVLPTDTPWPEGARSMLVYTLNQYGEMNDGASSLIYDSGRPRYPPGGISFDDDDTTAGVVNGTVTVNKAENESDIADYTVYWASSTTQKLSSTPFATLTKTGSDPTYTLSGSIGGTISSSATHLLAYSRSPYEGESWDGVTTEIFDAHHDYDFFEDSIPGTLFSSGGGDWQASSSYADYGTYSIRSGDYSSGYSCISMRFFTNGGTMSFKYLTPIKSGGSSYDYSYLYFYIDGSYSLTRRCNSGSTSSWCEYSTTLSAGTRTLKWCSRAGSSEYEYVYVDSLNLPDITADTTAPSSASISINSAAVSTTDRNVTISLSAVDSIGITGYYVSESSTTPTVASSGWTTWTNWDTSYSNSSLAFQLSSDSGTKTVYAWYRDYAGNISSVTSDSIMLDDIGYDFEGSIPSGFSSTSGGSWQVDSSYAASGSYSMRSGDYSSGYSCISKDVTTSGGTMSFKYLTPIKLGGSSYDYSYLYFYIDGSYSLTRRCNSGSTSSWCEYSTTLSAGTRTLKWCSRAGSSEYEYVYVDSLAIPD